MTILYLNANIIYGECLNIISNNKWKRNIKNNVINKLKSCEYKLTTSVLTKMEIMQRLIREESCTVKKARNAYFKVLNKYNIAQLSSLNKKNLLTNSFIDFVASSNLDFKDALHLEIASKYGFIVVTHDKKFRKNFSKHQDKLKFYNSVVKPEDLFHN